MIPYYDLIVIGAGPGGYLPAIRAAKAGKKVALVDRGPLGGTCLNCGCIPTKTYLHTANLFREAKKAAGAGLIGCDGLSVSMRQLKSYKDQVVGQLRDGIGKQLAACRITFYAGNAVVEKDRLVRVVSDTEIQIMGTHILIAAGSEPSPLPIPGIGLPGVENSTTMLEREEPCKSLVIIGGGVIGMEFATIYSDLGCQVFVFEVTDRILPGMDKEISQNLKMILKKRGVQIHTGASVRKITKDKDGGLCCDFRENGTEAAVYSDLVLAAVGRRPCGEKVFSTECRENVRMDRGRIVVDEHFETSIPGIYAVGDAIGGIQLAHAATAEGYEALSHMFPGLPGKNLEVVPSCVYTDPEIACVGMTGEEAKAAGIETVTGKYIMSVNGKSVLSMQERGFIKIVAEKETKRILGAQLMCARATDMVGELGLAITKGLTVRDLGAVIMPHPTYCEGIGEAAEGIE